MTVTHDTDAGLPPFAAAMLRPAFYRHRPVEVELIQTHISYVFLAGDEVYKVKKPVRFSFLDFSTLALCRHFCHEEVRLNRRLASDVYRSVVAICAKGSRYYLGCEDDPTAIEYAVHMCRLRAERMLPALLNRNQVTPSLIEAIGTRLVQFHRAADSSPDVRAAGSPAIITHLMEVDFEVDFAEVRPFRGTTIPAGDDDAIQGFCRETVRQFAALLEERQMEGRVRNGHGDLRAEHICVTNGIIVFDCIEFNPNFRYRDVATEVAFLAMALDYAGHPELAEHLVAHYATTAGDAELPRLVPLFKCYLAYIRGKVDSLKSAEEEVGTVEQGQTRRSSAGYFALSYRYTWSYSPFLVVVAGLSGTGKSTVAAALQTRTGFTHINSDVVRKQLAGFPRTFRQVGAQDSGLYSPAHSARTYQRMYARAADALAHGRGVIIDATFQRPMDRTLPGH